MGGTLTVRPRELFGQLTAERREFSLQVFWFVMLS